MCKWNQKKLHTVLYSYTWMSDLESGISRSWGTFSLVRRLRDLKFFIHTWRNHYVILSYVVYIQLASIGRTLYCYMAFLKLLKNHSLRCLSDWRSHPLVHRFHIVHRWTIMTSVFYFVYGVQIFVSPGQHDSSVFREVKLCQLPLEGILAINDHLAAGWQY